MSSANSLFNFGLESKQLTESYASVVKACY